MHPPGVDPTPQEGSQPGASVTLNIVSPGIDEQKLTLPETKVATTVAQLKLRIQESLPSQPGPDQQRLIYQGRPLLLADATLATIFGPEALRNGDNFTIHMALRPMAPTSHLHRSGAAPMTSQSRHQDMDDPTSGLGSGHSRSPAPAPVTSTHPPGQGPQNTFQAGPAGFSSVNHVAGNGATPAGPQVPLVPVLDQGNHQTLPGSGPFQTNSIADAQSHMQRILGQQSHMEQHVNDHFAAQRRLVAQHRQAMALRNGPVNVSHGENGSGEDLRDPSTANSHGASTITQQPNDHGPRGFVQEGRGPAGSWRISVEQTTVHNPNMPSSSAFTAPFAAPLTAATTNGPAVTQPRSHLVSSLPPRTFPPRPPFAPQLPFSLPSRNAAFTNPSAFPQQLYLVTGPSGYQALLIPPEGPVSVSPYFNLSNPTPTRTLPLQPQTAQNGSEALPAPDGPGANADQLQAQEAQDQQQGDGAVDIVRILFPLGGHLWLLIRLLGFVYLLAGGTSWTRTILLSSIAMLVFVAQAGWLAPIAEAVGAPVRRRVERVVRVDGNGIDAAVEQLRRRRQEREQRDREQQGQHQTDQDENRQQAENEARPLNTARSSSSSRRYNEDPNRTAAERIARPGRADHAAQARTAPSGMAVAGRPGPAALQDIRVTPEQLAARLLRERDERDQSVIRSALRRLERGAALFVTSLIPGWGEEHVRAQQEQDARRARWEAEEEVARRRSDEQARDSTNIGAGEESSKTKEETATRGDGTGAQVESSRANGTSVNPEQAAYE